ncbi:MAG: hypothetical protein ACE5HE_14170, partial [Phycisphaerae bacterium]
RFLAAQLAKNHYFDIGAAKKDFGYTVEVSTEEGLRRLLDSLRSEPDTQHTPAGPVQLTRAADVSDHARGG